LSDNLSFIPEQHRYQQTFVVLTFHSGLRVAALIVKMPPVSSYRCGTTCKENREEEEELMRAA
jgi:hypothetical protein